MFTGNKQLSQPVTSQPVSLATRLPVNPCFTDAVMRWDDLSNIYVDWIEVLPTHADIFLYKRKNDQFRQGSWVKLARTGSADCPVAVLEEFMAVGGHTGHSKLFRNIYHSKYGVRLRRQPLTYSRALELVRDTFRNFELNPKDYGLHSFCSGAASAAAATEVPERLIAGQGRWKSLAAVRRFFQRTLGEWIKGIQSMQFIRTLVMEYHNYENLGQLIVQILRHT